MLSLDGLSSCMPLLRKVRMSLHPLSNIDLVERQFAKLASGPHPLTLDAGSLGCGLPAGPIPLDNLRIVLLKRQTNSLTKSAVWARLVRLAHEQPDPWIMAATGMMVPGLKRIGGNLGSWYAGDKRDLDSVIVEGFLQALRHADPARSRLYAQLYWAAFRSGYEACHKESRLTGQYLELKDSPPQATDRAWSGHPDLVLAAAMLDGAVTPHQADLLCGVYLDHTRRGDVARELGVSRYQVRLELAAAERGLAKYLITA